MENWIKVGAEAQFTVSDTGPGIPANDLARVFEPYWSGQRNATKGTGLGLYIVNKEMDRHQGKIQVESSPGHGTTFKLSFPKAKDQQLGAA